MLYRRINRYPGFTLVEVLVTLVIMSLGLLAIGKLILLAARANDSAYMRSQATALGYSILDAARANRQAALNGDYVIALGVMTGSPVICAAAGACDDSQLAQSDLANWKTRLQAALPSGDGSVATTSITDAVSGASLNTVTVVVQWNDSVAQQVFGVPAGKVAVTLESIL